MNKKKILLILIFVILILPYINYFWTKYQYNKLNSGFDEGAIIWSMFDYNGNESIVFFRLEDLMRNRYPITYVYDYLDNMDFVGLTYPYQNGERIYYTTHNKKSKYDSIICRFEDKIELILSKNGYISHKKIFNNQLYYIMNDELWRSNLSNKSDELVISDLNFMNGFDINENGEILYTSNMADRVMLLKQNGNKCFIAEGKAAKFIDNDNIIFVNEESIISLNLKNNFKKIIKKDVNCTYILLNPKKTHVFYIHLTEKYNLLGPLEILNYMKIDGNFDARITRFPSNAYPDHNLGIEWINYRTKYFENNVRDLIR